MLRQKPGTVMCSEKPRKSLFRKSERETNEADGQEVVMRSRELEKVTSHSL